MNHLTFVRHGENRANLTKEFSHRLVDYPLTPKGVLQAQQTAEHFAVTGRRVDAVFASPLKRSHETATIIAERLGLGVTSIEAFREIDVGTLEGQPPTPELWQAYFAVIAAWLNGHPERRFPGGENYHELWARMQAGLRQVVAGRAGQRLLLVGHGGQLMMTLPDLCPGTAIKMLFEQHSHNCSVTEVAVRLVGNRPVGELITWSDASHLHGEAAHLVEGMPIAPPYRLW